ncbi:MAG: hypothetical protein ACE5MG_08740 [Candidatus Methylomirabilales bacterium]
MEIPLSDIWVAAGFLIGLQAAAFTWRVSREIAVSERGDITWLPPADLLNLLAMLVAFLGVFVPPIVGLRTPNVPQVALGLSIVLFASYPFALAGHYDLYVKGPRSYKYATGQEVIAIAVALLAATAYLLVSVIGQLFESFN